LVNRYGALRVPFAQNKTGMAPIGMGIPSRLSAFKLTFSSCILL
jgi:hypothetical protein